MSTLTLAAVQSRPPVRLAATPTTRYVPTADEVLVDALDLKPGMVVVDDFTAWAQVETADRFGDWMRVTWLLANGQRDRDVTYQPTDCFSLLPSKPDLCAKDGCYLAASGASARADDNPAYCAGCNAAWWDAVLG